MRRQQRIPVAVQGHGPHGAGAGARRVRAPWARLLWGAAEVTVTCGLVLLLFVVHQLWWTNREARAGAQRQVRALEKEWERADTGSGAAVKGDPRGGSEGDARDGSEGDAKGGSEGGPRSGSDGDSKGGRRGGSAPGGPPPRTAAPRWDQAYAVLRIPALGVTTPVAQGVGKRAVLDKGYVGHYPGTAQPGEPGNFALAGHRNSHGEPFRRIDRLRVGDEVRVESRTAYYVYVVDQTLPQTAPSDRGVIAPVPRSRVKPRYGYAVPGRYLTLTTCAPEFSSTHRLVVWGKLKSVRPK